MAVTAGIMAMGPLRLGAEEAGNLVFFRGGWASLSSNRANELFTDVNGASGVRQTGTEGYYIGAGLDLMLSRDAWGLTKDIAVLGEIGVEYKRWESKTTFNTGTVFAGGPESKTPLTMLTVDVAPKVKFMQGSRFQPWVIPIGVDFHVISPPSNTTTYLDIGAQWGAGAEYRLWKEFKVGVDGRYHLASGATGTVNNYGTVGAYVGIGF